MSGRRGGPPVTATGKMTGPDHFAASTMRCDAQSKLALPLSEALRDRLLGALVDLGVGQGAERMTDHNGREVGHAE
jgi:hypothetical protein